MGLCRRPEKGESMKLSANFDSKEFKCDHCDQSFADKRLVDALQKLRDAIGKPIKILSGFRCVQNNKEAGGGKNSQHLYGKAADIVIEGMSVKEMYYQALTIDDFNQGGIGIYPDNNFIHVDVRDGKARWARVGKGKQAKYVSIEEGLKKC
jgi:uncharacterized protein YcbK (DUF882 family)